MLRITSSGNGAGPRHFRLEGRLADRWVEELARESELALAAEGALTLDLSFVTFVDARGASLLRALARRGVELTGGSSFIATLLSGGLP
jgi:ABC-type transporter Mla MlaB component